MAFATNGLPESRAETTAPAITYESIWCREDKPSEEVLDDTEVQDPGPHACTLGLGLGWKENGMVGTGSSWPGWAPLTQHDLSIRAQGPYFIDEPLTERKELPRWLSG